MIGLAGWLFLFLLPWAPQSALLAGLAALAGTPLLRFRYPRLWEKRARFVYYFAYQVLKANLEVARIVLWPGRLYAPAFLRLPVEGMSDTQVTLLANLITFTPGTLSLDVSEDRKYLYIHCLRAPDPERVRHDLLRLKETFLRLVYDK